MDSQELLNKKTNEKYTFQKIFNEKNNNLDIYHEIGEKLLNQALQGFNGCVFAYG